MPWLKQRTVFVVHAGLFFYLEDASETPQLEGQTLGSLSGDQRYTMQFQKAVKYNNNDSLFLISSVVTVDLSFRENG